MKKGGLVLAVMLAISGFLRLTGPVAAPSAPIAAQTTPKGRQPAPSPASPYEQDLRRTIQEFCDVWQGDPSETIQSSAHGNAPNACDQVHFVIALVPDPVHTHLALLFDRSVEALQQAAQRKGYAFDRAILPWDLPRHTDATEADKPQQQVEAQRNRESFPGLLIFRSESTGEGEKRVPLFVLVVGETPTGGLHKKQFQNALDMVRQIRATIQGEEPLRILGPTFSGSLESLQRELPEATKLLPFSEAYIYSGTATDAASMHAFESQLDSPHIPPYGHFASFQQNDSYVLRHFAAFVCAQGYELSEVAVLSEDQTVYGANVPQSQGASGQPEIQS
jgi:hypothetical protein